MPNFQVLDAYGSVITIESSTVGGANRQVVAATTGNSSVQVLGNVTTQTTTPSSMLTGASIFGMVPAGTQVIGSVAVLQGTSPWRTVTSVSGSVDIGVTPGSVVAFQGTDPWRISSVYGNISGSVLSQQLGTRISSVISSAPSSMLTGASIFGQLPAGTAMLGSVAALQGNAVWNIAGSVASQQLGTRISSVVNSLPSSLLAGTYAHRNDNVASFLGGNLTWNPIATDSAGRVLTMIAPEEARVEGYTSTVNTSQTQLIAAAGAGLRNYITDIWFASTGSVATLITLRDSANSVLGYTIAPSNSGSNLPGLKMPIRTGANAAFDFQATTGVSVLYATAKGYKAP